MPLLTIVLDQVAALRQARRSAEPDPVAAAYLAQMAGADGIAVHLYGDRRHVQERDVDVLRQTVTAPLHLMTAATAESVRVASAMKPATVTLLPERREEVTTEGGIDVLLSAAVVDRTLGALHESGFKVTLLVEPELDQIRAAAKAGADALQINTRHFAEAGEESASERELMRLQEAVRGASKLRMKVIAGLGLNYATAARVARIPEVSEIRVGHAVIARACLVGIDRAVREMKALVG